ncbi:MAG: CRTAC1 family protein [Acidobacteria bacterium]|nr:MAG: CRTAC1 family protein [Acidobacteriota bacterium]
MTRPAFLLTAGLLAGTYLYANGFTVSFTDVTKEAGLVHPVIYGGVDKKRYIIETNGPGVAFADFDNDGWMDILTLTGSRLEGFPEGKAPTNRMYLNRQDGTFKDVTDQSGLNNPGWASAVTVGDYDNDGWVDLFITCWGQNRLYRNRGKWKTTERFFQDVTLPAGLGQPETRWGSGCVFLDYDRDGDLDLFVANYLKFDLKSAPTPGKGPNCLWKGVPVNCGPKGLPTDTNLLYRNRGGGTFEDVSKTSGVGLVQGKYAMTALVTDYNNDAWPDIYVACDSTACILYRNNQDGTFTDVALEAGAAYSEDGQSQAGMGVASGDYDGDGLLDIFKTHFADDLPVLYRNTGEGYFEDASRAAGFDHTRYVQWGTGLADLDNDTWPDIFTVAGSVYPEVEARLKEYPHRNPRLVYRNLGNGRFQDVSNEVGPAVQSPYSSRGCAFADYDNDGDIDILAMNMNEPPQLLRNEHITANRPGNNWLKLQLVGKRSNRSAIGARVRLWIGERVLVQELTSQASYYSSNDPRLHFGLGAAQSIDRGEVRWPNGNVQVLQKIQPNQIITIEERGD